MNEKDIREFIKKVDHGSVLEIGNEKLEISKWTEGFHDDELVYACFGLQKRFWIYQRNSAANWFFGGVESKQSG